jgi:hypothetical protein
MFVVHDVKGTDASCWPKERVLLCSNDRSPSPRTVFASIDALAKETPILNRGGGGQLLPTVHVSSIIMRYLQGSNKNQGTTLLRAGPLKYYKIFIAIKL